MIPAVYLNDMYDVGKAELESALNMNVLGLVREVSNHAPNKWFGSEMYLATYLSKIMERTTGCQILDHKYLEALDKVKKSAKAPCWANNAESHRNQMYALLSHDAYKRLLRRFMGLNASHDTVQRMIGDCTFQRGYLEETGVRSEHTLEFWGQMTEHGEHTINGMFWSERAFGRMHRALYQQCLQTFFRRGPFYERYRNFSVKNDLSQRYTFPQVVRSTKWNENLRNRLRRFGIETISNAQYGWRAWQDEVSSEENESDSQSHDQIMNARFGDVYTSPPEPVGPTTHNENRQSETGIHRSGVTREDLMNVTQEPGELTMLEIAANVARAAQPALDEFTETCRNFSRQTGRSASAEESAQNVERAREEWSAESAREMCTLRPEGEETVTPSPARSRYLEAIENASRSFNIDGTISSRAPGRMTHEQIDSQTGDPTAQLREEWLELEENINNMGEPQ